MGITAIGTVRNAYGMFGSPSVNTGNSATQHTINMVAGQPVEIWGVAWNNANGFSGDGLPPLSGFTDTKGNTWSFVQQSTLTANLESGNLSHHFSFIARCTPTTATLGGSSASGVVVTPQFRSSNGGNRYSAIDFQITGLDASPLDKLATYEGGENTTGTPSLATGALAQSGEQVVAMVGGEVQNITPPSGWTVIVNQSASTDRFGLCVAYVTAATTASVTAAFTHDAAFYGSRAFIRADRLAALALRIKVLADAGMKSATACQGYVWTDGNPGASIGKAFSGVTAQSALDGSGNAVAYIPVDAAWGLSVGGTVAVAMKGVGAQSPNVGVDCGLVYIKNATVESA